MKLLRPLILALLATVLFVAASARASDPTFVPKPKSRPQVTSTVGIENTFLFRYSGPELRAKPFDDHSPISVRIADVTPDGASSIYDLRFIGRRPGVFDLRRALARVDNLSLLRDSSEAVVEIKSVLPFDHDGTVAQVSTVAPTRLGGYSLALIAFGILWLVPPAWFIISRLTRPTPVVVDAPAPPTLADQLRPLVESAVAGRASVAEQAQLEMLLIAYWRDRLSLRGLPHRAAVDRLRAEPQAGALLTAVEGWLHKPASSSAAMLPAEVTTLLAPFATVAAVETVPVLAEPKAATLNGHHRRVTGTTGGAS